MEDPPLVKPELQRSIEDLLHTETLLPRPRDKLDLPPFKKYDFEYHGNDVLLVIPTENEDKVNTLRAWFKELKPPGVQIRIEPVKAASGVGQQPYDGEGIWGAHNRITNALDRLHSEPKLVDFESWSIGTVIVASIENFIRKTNVERPTDYGMIIVHNATTGRTDYTLSQGVTVPVPYLEHAQTFGYEDSDGKHGKVTAGEVLEGNVPGVDGADWHKVVVGVPRYHILKEAMRVLENPMVGLSGSENT